MLRDRRETSPYLSLTASAVRLTRSSSFNRGCYSLEHALGDQLAVRLEWREPGAGVEVMATAMTDFSGIPGVRGRASVPPSVDENLLPLKSAFIVPMLPSHQRKGGGKESAKRANPEPLRRSRIVLRNHGVITVSLFRLSLRTTTRLED